MIYARIHCDIGRFRPVAALAVVGLVLTAALGGCAAGNIGESIPQNLGGLPQATPGRPVAPGAFPAVHDIPPERGDQVLDVSEQERLENDLKALRTRQEQLSKQAEPDADDAGPQTKPKPAAAPTRKGK